MFMRGELENVNGGRCKGGKRGGDKEGKQRSQGEEAVSSSTLTSASPCGRKGEEWGDDERTGERESEKWRGGG